MATAYAALVSLVQTTEPIQHHPRPPISLDKQQLQSLQEHVAFLQDFLEQYSHRLTQDYEDGLMVRIADAAHAAEDVIESHIVDQILDGQSTTTSRENISSIDHHFYQDLQKVIADMDLIKNEVIEIKESMGIVHDQLHRNSVPAGSLSSSPLTGQKQAMVGVDDILDDIMDKLTRQQSGCQIVPIIGMGGIGKTTLARHVYENPLIVEYFDIRAWVTVSREYNTREILLNLVSQKSKETMEIMSEEELGEMLYKSLAGKRYLIIMDDMWSIEAWDNVKLFFPNNNSESKIMITTRLSNLALQISGSYGLWMNFLDENKSWELFCKIVFGEVGNCPLDLEEVAKRVARNCNGLPLSVIVIGGLLAKSEKAQGYWKYIADNLSSIVNLEDNERCLRILYTSYQELPIHLKPCFLYMGVLPEDSMTYVSRLRKLWVAEGFLKPISGKSLEEVAEEYLKDLIDRNLIVPLKMGSTGKIKVCSMHDLLRDLCLREAEKQKFLSSLEIGQAITTNRRIVVHKISSKDRHDLHRALRSAQLVRSLTCDLQEALPLASCRLLRVLKNTYSEDVFQLGREDGSLTGDIFKLVNSRYLALGANLWFGHAFPSSMHLLWNLQTLILRTTNCKIIDAPPGIWKMHQLRHVDVNLLRLPDLTADEFVLPNLQKMSEIVNFECCEAVVKRIPNIKKLRICYNDFYSLLYCLNNLGHSDISSMHYSVENLGRFQKLESLCFSLSSMVRRSDMLERLCFPNSLKKLSLRGCRLQWEDITRKIGPLPLLQVLKLHKDSVIGSEWETVEGQFRRLSVLEITDIDDLEYWTVDNSHFPCLHRLCLRHLRKLKKIPWGFAEIQTLELIELAMCSDSAVISVKEIAEQQEELGNEDLQVVVRLEPDSELQPQLKSLENHRFRVF